MTSFRNLTFLLPSADASKSHNVHKLHQAILHWLLKCHLSHTPLTFSSRPCPSSFVPLNEHLVKSSSPQWYTHRLPSQPFLCLPLAWCTSASVAPAGNKGHLRRLQGSHCTSGATKARLPLCLWAAE